MSDNIKKTSSSPITPTPTSRTSGTAETSKVKRPSDSTPSISSLPLSKTLPSKEELIPLPQPTEDPNPAEATKKIKELANEKSRTLQMSGSNALALINLYEKSGARELTSQELEQLKKVLGTRSPEEIIEGINDALETYAIESNGEFTEDFTSFLQDPPIPPLPPSGPFEPPIGPGEDQKEKFSFFTLLLLLNQLASFQRDMAAKSMQLEQAHIQAGFDIKKEAIMESASKQWWTSFGFAIVSGGFGFASAGFTAMGEKISTNKAWAGAFRTLSDLTSSIGQSTSKYMSSSFEAQSAEREKKESGHNFNQQSQRSNREANAQQQEALMRTAEQFALEQSVKTIARNI